MRFGVGSVASPREHRAIYAGCVVLVYRLPVGVAVGGHCAHRSGADGLFWPSHTACLCGGFRRRLSIAARVTADDKPRESTLFQRPEHVWDHTPPWPRCSSKSACPRRTTGRARRDKEASSPSLNHLPDLGGSVSSAHHVSRSSSAKSPLLTVPNSVAAISSCFAEALRVRQARYVWGQAWCPPPH